MAELLEALQRNAYFLQASARALPWLIEAALLAERRKDLRLFTELAALNERFCKLQDSLGHAMRHAALLAGEPAGALYGGVRGAGALTSASRWPSSKQGGCVKLNSSTRWGNTSGHRSRRSDFSPP
jgi:hypothetical protein